MSDNEQWKPVVGWDGIYEVSDQGRVRSLDRVVAKKNGDAIARGRVLSPYYTRDGYYRVALHRVGFKSHKLVHVLVAESFIGAKPDGCEVCHNNGLAHDNRVENLRWDTHASNVEDTRKHGTMIGGERAGNSKLTEDQVKEIRRLAAAGSTRNEIAKTFGMARRGIDQIVNGQRWAHVQPEDFPEIDREIAAIEKRARLYAIRFPWKMTSEGGGRDHLAQDRERLLAEIRRLRALPIPSTGAESETTAAEPEPQYDGSDDFYERHRQWALRTGHGYGGDSRDVAVIEPQLSPDEEVEFQAWLAAGKPTLPTPTESEKETK